jgi:ferric-dicitrate binding protein FerR (iron transport regulator)
MSQEPREPDYVATLVRTAGRRAAPDAARFERARKTVRAEWRTVLARERYLRQLRFAAVFVVAAFTGVLAAVFWPTAAQPIAKANRVVGDVLVRHVQQGRMQVEPLKLQQVLVSGMELDTGSSGRVRLDWANGAQLSVDRGSLVELRSENELRLSRGAVYVQTRTNEASQTRRLVVTTPFGTARHIGTKYEVLVTPANARVRVREGLVSFAEEQRSPITIKAGQQLSVAVGSHSLEAGPGSADPAWDWIQTLAPPLMIEGRSAFDALESLSEETGLRVVYADDKARSLARTVILRGSIEGLDTRKAMIAVLAGSGLVFEIRGDRVEIRADEEL